MRKMLTTTLLLVAATVANGQIEKGSWLMGASTNLGYISYTPTGGGSSQNFFNIGTKSGYFIANNMTIGVNLDYLNASGSSGSTNSITTIGIFLRGYSKKVFFGVGYNSISMSGSSTSLGSIPLEVGYAAFITRNIAFEPAINYTFATDSDNGGMPGYAGVPFGAKSAFGIKLGFSLYLGRPASE